MNIEKSIQFPSPFTSFFTLILLIRLLESSPCLAQQDNTLIHSSPVFDSISFRQNWELSNWLYEYEEFSWYTNDHKAVEQRNALIRFGQIGFCFQDKSGSWHCIKGINDQGSFTITKHIGPDSLSFLSSADTAMFQVFSRALTKCHSKLGITLDSIGLYFDQYIWRLPDSTIQVYVIPAFQPSGQAIYGLEWGYRFTADGSEVITSSSYSPGYKAIWVGQPREIRLQYRECNTPTLGSLCFANSFKDFFTRIIIEMDSLSLILYRDSNGYYKWEKVFKNKSN
jgi:hypothetical protein